MKKALFAILMTFVLAGGVLAGGSFEVERVVPLLKQNPDIYEFVLRNLELEKSGVAVRIGSRVNPDFGRSPYRSLFNSS